MVIKNGGVKMIYEVQRDVNGIFKKANLTDLSLEETTAIHTALIDKLNILEFHINQIETEGEDSYQLYLWKEEKKLLEKMIGVLK